MTLSELLSAPFPARNPLRRPSARATLAATFRHLALATALALTATAASAHDASDPLYDVVSLSVDADVEIDNDLMRATLVVQAEAKEPDALADEINRTMRWALDALEGYPGIERETRDYRTWARRDTSRNRALIGWAGSQSLALESADFAAMGKAIQTLQERLQVQGTALDVSRATRRAASDELIDEALDAFERRAARIADNLGASGYRILEVDVRLGSSGYEAPMMRSASRSMAYDSAVAEPGIAGGSSRLDATASGRIRLERAD